MIVSGYLRLAIALPLVCASQIYSQSVRPVDPRANINTPPGFYDSNNARMNAFRNQERQKSLLKDTDRLLKLTQELANTDPQSLNSPENLKKFAEVEKLAKRIKQNMKGD